MPASEALAFDAGVKPRDTGPQSWTAMAHSHMRPLINHYLASKRRRPGCS